jgi:hypothetical protein
MSISVYEAIFLGFVFIILAGMIIFLEWFDSLKVYLIEFANIAELQMILGIQKDGFVLFVNPVMKKMKEQMI